MENIRVRVILSILLVMLFAGNCAFAESEDKYVVDGAKTVLIDQDDFCLYLTGENTATDNFNGISGNYIFNLNCVVENKSNRVIDGITYTGVINGWSLGSDYVMNGTNDLQPGTKAKTNIWFSTEDTEITSLEELETMDLTFSVKDENYNEILKVDTGIIHFGEPAENSASTPETYVPAESTQEPVIIYGEYKTLETGSKGEDVKQLQKALIEKGVLSGDPDGIYGKGTAGAVAKFQESIGLEANGIADEETQRSLFGGIDVLEALMKEPWYFNGGSDTTLNVLNFTEGTATISQIVYDGNGQHLNAENDYSYVLSNDNVTITLIDGSELVIPFTVSGNQLILNNHEYWSASDVNEGLLGYWKCRYTDDFSVKHEEHVYLGEGVIKHESANEGSNLAKGEYYYYGPYEAPYTLGIGCFETEMRHGSEFGFNIIENKPVLLRYDRVFEPTTEDFPGVNGYKF